MDQSRSRNSPMRVVVILPTYNERDNIRDLIVALQDQFKRIAHDMQILVVDDNSPDGTGQVIQQEQKHYPNLHLLSGEKQGLGAAYFRGMNYAIQNLHADAVMEMDADFSHNPADVPRMIEALNEADFVVGSRYIKGGKIPDNWSLLRKANSKWGNVFARYVAGLTYVHDCTAGFRAIRASILSKIGLNNVRVRGYCFQIYLLHKALVNNALIKEIPVEFVDRKRGKTKLGFKDIIEFLLNVWWIRFERSDTFLRFLLVGGLGTIVNLGSLTLFIRSGLNKFVASPISIELSIMSNFLLNNYWTFARRQNEDKLQIKGLKFNLISLLSLAISYSSFVLLSLILPQIHPLLAQATGILPATIVNYLGNSYWTFAE